MKFILGLLFLSSAAFATPYNPLGDGVGIATTSPTANQVLTYNATTNLWQPQTPSGGFSSPVANNTPLQWTKFGGGSLDVLNLNGSDNIFLGPSTGNAFIRVVEDGSGPGSGYINVVTQGTGGLVDAETTEIEIYNNANVTPGVRFWDQNNSNFMLLKPADTIPTSFTLTFPDNDGNSGEFLQTDGAGVLSWAAGGGGVTNPLANNTPLQWNDSGATPTDILNFNAANHVILGGATVTRTEILPGGGQVWLGTTSSVATAGVLIESGEIDLIPDPTSDPNAVVISWGKLQVFGDYDGSTLPAQVDFFDVGANNGFSFRARTAFSGTTVAILPDGNGSTGQVLTTDGANPASLTWSGGTPGTVCGWYDTVGATLIVSCNGSDPNTACPTGFTQKTTTGAKFCAAN